jgi:N-acetylglucosaminyl-diphospho-decaprenol L-rhamnosyltransferase
VGQADASGYIRRSMSASDPPPGPEPLTVVLVHWNQPERCAATIEAFQDQGLDVAVVVVDNGSEPLAFGRLRTLLANGPHDVELIPLGANTGFGPGANVGLAAFLDGRAGEWVAVAPHDALPHPGVLARLVAAAEQREAETGGRVGLVCADVGDGHVPVVDPYFGGMTVAAPAGDGWLDADYPHGTLLVARRACLRDIGLFDERYFAYCEEADLGIRARAAGWQVGLVRGARVVNPTMRSGSPVTDYLMHRNTLLLVREHSGRYHAFIRFVLALGQLVRGVLRPTWRPWMFSARGRVWGLVDFARGRFGPPPPFLFTPAPTAVIPPDPATGAVASPTRSAPVPVPDA